MFGEFAETAGMNAEADEGRCGEGCCGRSTDERVETGHGKEEPAQHTHVPGESCPSCPSCAGPIGGAGLAEVTRYALDEAIGGMSGAIAAVTFWWSEHAGRSDELGLEWPGERPRLKRANREALRWHCALMV